MAAKRSKRTAKRSKRGKGVFDAFGNLIPSKLPKLILRNGVPTLVKTKGTRFAPKRWTAKRKSKRTTRRRRK